MDVVDISECFLLSREADVIRNLFRDYMKEKGIKGWDRVSRRGDVRFLTIMEGKFTGERLVALIVYDLKDTFNPIEFLSILREHGVNVNGFVVGINRGVRNDARAEEIKIYYGSDTIRERIGDYTYLLHPNVFFQPNSYTVKYIIETVIDFIEPKGYEKVLELYSGIGTFSIPISFRVSGLTSVELDINAVKIFRINAEVNRARRITVVNRNAEDVSVKDYDIVIMNPPRSGISRRLAKRIKKTRPERIIYISCGLESLARDIREMGYRIDRLVLVDHFPHTNLIESVVLLKNR